MAAAEAPAIKRGRVTLAWDYSPDPVVVRYRVYFGQESGFYTNSAVVGRTNHVTLSGLNEGARYYAVCVAVDATELESVPSNEISFVTSVWVNLRLSCVLVETHGVVGRTNDLLVSTNLVNWAPVLTFVGQSGVLRSWTATNSGKNFFRVKERR